MSLPWPSLPKAPEPHEKTWPAVVATIGVFEFFSIVTIDGGFEVRETFASGAKREAGDFYFDPLGLKPKDAEAFAEMQTKEINNGRAPPASLRSPLATHLSRVAHEPCHTDGSDCARRPGHDCDGGHGRAGARHHAEALLDASPKRPAADRWRAEPAVVYQGVSCVHTACSLLLVNLGKFGYCYCFDTLR